MLMLSHFFHSSLNDIQTTHAHNIFPVLSVLSVSSEYVRNSLSALDDFPSAESMSQCVCVDSRVRASLWLLGSEPRLNHMWLSHVSHFSGFQHFSNTLKHTHGTVKLSNIRKIDKRYKKNASENRDDDFVCTSTEQQQQHDDDNDNDDRKKYIFAFPFHFCSHFHFGECMWHRCFESSSSRCWSRTE